MGRFLLDTHTFLWFITDDGRLSRTALRVITDPSNDILVSIVTPWEIAIKAGLGKLTLAGTFFDYIPDQIESNDFELLPITLAHTAAVATLPRHHGDPFDRMLVAQAGVEGTPILSADTALDAYGIVRIW
jgi:PIN domain nuclease of toxin-antitoxin system